jgi:hypothetical protein
MLIRLLTLIHQCFMRGIVPHVSCITVNTVETPSMIQWTSRVPQTLTTSSSTTQQRVVVPYKYNTTLR